MRRGSRPIVAIGEILWDVFPDGKCLGGAPFNFAFHCHQLGEDVRIVSRVGDDELGSAIHAELIRLKINNYYVQFDPDLPTSKVMVTFSEERQPIYQIVPNVAWDRIDLTEDVEELIDFARVVCFGSVALGPRRSRDTIFSVLGPVGDRGSHFHRVFDVNLRSGFDDRKALEEALARSDWVKINAEEFMFLRRWLDLKGNDEAAQLDHLRSRFGLELVCLTLGAQGCFLSTKQGLIRENGVAVDVVDTVGACDAFTAALVVRSLAGRPLRPAARFANRYAALVAGRRGATPILDPETIRRAVDEAERSE